MRKHLESQLQAAIDSLISSGELSAGISYNAHIERARDPRHGDFASNIALTLARQAKCNPRQLAEKIVHAIPQDNMIEKMDVAGPGFINFHLNALAQHQVIKQIHQASERFGTSSAGVGRKVQVEFVSANPTGPLHVGHGRGAAYGAAVANLLSAAGFEVQREYYVNDAGRQMDILAVSVWLRYLEECGEVNPFPANGYRGDYVREIARAVHAEDGNDYRHPGELVMENLPPDESQNGDKEIHIDALVGRAKTLLGEKQYGYIFQAGLDWILKDIREDLSEFGVEFDAWFSERQLLDCGEIDAALEKLGAAGFLYEEQGATWFASTRFGDEKDRVVVRENGQKTYFASDIAYHLNKLERGFDRIIDIWGADHHGYIDRVNAAMQALDLDESKLSILLVQFAVLYRGEEKVQMSTRSGEFVTLRQLRNEVGKDAARFFYVMRKAEQHMDFDLRLATSRSNENPVYYVQYAHARVCSVFRQLDEKGLVRNIELGMNNLELLVEAHEEKLAASLTRYPEILETAALRHEPHQLVYYLRELANEFHTYYNAHQFLVNQDALRNARLNLIFAVKQVISNGLALLNVSAPESM